MKSLFENRLSAEKSPYLRQHAANPVAWQPWDDETLRLARNLDRPIFLSIGYSTCHWCHVMEHESFEDPEVARQLNTHTVPIKVDREERPDLDALYMEALLGMAGQGGWPMSIFLTPEGKPFFGGTYFPRARFLSLLGRVADAWKSQRTELEASGEKISLALRAEPKSAGALPERSDWTRLFVEQFERGFDPEQGGRLGAPKFPCFYDLSFMLRATPRFAPSARASAIRMASTTLERMFQGGIYDHLGGGFHRYSTDERWLVPHFEKMLYDQAAGVRTLVDLHVATAGSDPRYETVARETCDYVLREMTHADGGFFSAEDADSEGVEGRFYVWTPDEIRAVLKDEDRARDFCDAYDVTTDGNFEHGWSILHSDAPRERFAAERALLKAARDRRPKPLRDEKVLVAWNGLMIAALARAGLVFGEARYLAAAVRCARFILERARIPSAEPKQGSQRTLLARRWMEGEARHRAYSEDYAFLIDGLIELHRAQPLDGWLQPALELQDELDTDYWDEAAVGYFFTATETGETPLIRRGKEYFDNVTPSSNSVAAHNLARLSLLSSDPSVGTGLAERADRTLASFPHELFTHPKAFPRAGLAIIGDFAEVKLSRSTGIETLNHAVTRLSSPEVFLSVKEGGESGPTGTTAAQICDADGVCGLPFEIKKPEDLLEALRSKFS